MAVFHGSAVKYSVNIILLLLPILLPSGGCSAPTTSLVILVDDLGYNDLNINNSDTTTPTPNLDLVAQQGVRFTRHFADSTCSPAPAHFIPAKSYRL
jgi:hypothetical protein